MRRSAEMKLVINVENEKKMKKLVRYANNKEKKN